MKDGDPEAPGGLRTPKPDLTEEQLAALEKLTESLPVPLRVFRDRGLLSDKRRFYLEEALRHRTRTLVTVLHGVDNPHNQAAVLRSSEALGIQEVHLTGVSAFRPSSRVTQNAHRWLDVTQYDGYSDAFDALRSRGFRLLAAAAGPASLSLFEIDFIEPHAIILGSESRGLPNEVITACDATFTIPLYGLSQSLNVSVAAALSLSWAVETRRRAWGKPGDLTTEELAELRQRFYRTAANRRLPANADDLLS